MQYYDHHEDSIGYQYRGVSGSVNDIGSTQKGQTIHLQDILVHETFCETLLPKVIQFKEPLNFGTSFIVCTNTLA